MRERGKTGRKGKRRFGNGQGATFPTSSPAQNSYIVTVPSVQ